MRLHDDTTPRVIFGVAAYVLVAVVLCGAAIFGLSRLLAAPEPGNPGASRAPAHSETTGAASRKEAGRDKERRPAWISPTPKYEMGPRNGGARARQAARSEPSTVSQAPSEDRHRQRYRAGAPGQAPVYDARGNIIRMR